MEKETSLNKEWEKMDKEVKDNHKEVLKLTEKETSLSDKRLGVRGYPAHYYREKDIKEAVKRLKDKVSKEAIERGINLDNSSLDRLPVIHLIDLIDEIFGEKLI